MNLMNQWWSCSTYKRVRQIQRYMLLQQFKNIETTHMNNLYVMQWNNDLTHAYGTNSIKGSSYELGPKIWTLSPNILAWDKSLVPISEPVTRLFQNSNIWYMYNITITTITQYQIYNSISNCKHQHHNLTTHHNLNYMIITWLSHHQYNLTPLS